jgi:hypothetical protein
MARDGSVGRETFEQVEALVKQGKSKSEAFAQIASDTGRNSGTVAANYYRVARATGAVKPRRRRAKAAPRASTRKVPAARSSRPARNDNIDQITADLVRNVQALAEAVKTQDAEVKELRGRLDGVRGLLG